MDGSLRRWNVRSTEATKRVTPGRRSKAGPTTFPMRVVTRLTGLTADTVRVWERRYGAVVPERTDGKARRYSPGEVERLGLLKRVTDVGHSIGSVAALSNARLETLLNEASGPGTALALGGEGRWNAVWDAYLRAIERFDMRRADEILSRAATLTSPRELAIDVIAPLLRTVGERWQHGELSVAQEHAVSAHCRALLGSQLRTTASDAGAPRVLLAAPEGHEHDLGLMIGGVLAASRKASTVHLGANVPWADLEEAVRIAKPDLVLLAFTRGLSREERKTTPVALRRLSALTELWVGAPPGHTITSTRSARVFGSFEDLDAALAMRFAA